jgi:hypothetical protein
MEKEYKGVWWMPDTPDVKIHGTLYPSKTDRSILELDGHLIDVKPFTHVRFAPEIVLGQSMEGTRVTLYKSIQINVSVGLNTGLKTSKLLVQLVLIGAHFGNAADLRFKSVAIEFRRLDDWIRLSGFDVKFNGPETVVTYARPQPIGATLDDMQISLEFQEHPHIDRPREVGIRQEVFFKIETNSEKSPEDFQNIIYQLQNFLSLALEEAAYPQSIMAYSSSVAIEIEGKRVPEPIEIVFRFGGTGSNGTRYETLFEFQDIATRFETVLKLWFDKTELLQPIYFAYFGPMYYPMYLELRFLWYTQAVESYHRRVIGNCVLPETEHAKRMLEVMNAVPQNHRDWLDDELKYSNEPSFRRRLRELFSKFPWIDPGDKAFISKVVVTRNYLTHYDTDLKESAASGEELYAVSLKFELLIKAILLTELGFDAVKDMIARTSAYRNLFRV